MNADEKRQVVSEILESMQFGSHIGSDDVPASMRSLYKTFRDKQFEAMVGLYVQHLTDEQVRALSDFHQSSMGRAIARNQAKIHEGFRALLPKLASEMDALSHKHASEGTDQEVIAVSEARIASTVMSKAHYSDAEEPGAQLRVPPDGESK